MIDKFGAILHEKWYSNPTCSPQIIGTWAEDGSKYTITCPGQLINLIIELQNILSEQYQLLEKKRKELRDLEYNIKKVIGE